MLIFADNAKVEIMIMINIYPELGLPPVPPELRKQLELDTQKLQKAEFLKSDKGQLLTFLEEKGKLENKKVELGKGLYNNTNKYKYGEEIAHIKYRWVAEDTFILGTFYTDLQKKWWKEAFLDYFVNEKNNPMHLMYPNIMECLNVSNFKKDNMITKFCNENIFNDLFKENIDLKDKEIETKIINSIIKFFNNILKPDFSCKIDYKNDYLENIFLKINLVPLNTMSKDMLLTGNKEFQQLCQKILYNYEEMILFIKNNLLL